MPSHTNQTSLPAMEKLLQNPLFVIEQLKMLEPHNPPTIQNFGWSQVQPIQKEIVVSILPKFPAAARVVLSILDRYELSWAKYISQMISSDLANALIDQNAIEILMNLFGKSQDQIWIQLIIHLITYNTNNGINVTSLFKLSSLSPLLMELTFKNLEGVAELPSEPKTDGQF